MFFRTFRNEVYSHTDCKINAKSLENIFTKPSLIYPKTHPLNHTSKHQDLSPRHSPLLTSPHVPHPKLLIINNIFPHSPPHFSTFPHPHTVENSTSLKQIPTYPRVFHIVFHTQNLNRNPQS